MAYYHYSYRDFLIALCLLFTLYSFAAIFYQLSSLSTARYCFTTYP
jgi:hypothetical protein